MQTTDVVMIHEIGTADPDLADRDRELLAGTGDTALAATSEEDVRKDLLSQRATKPIQVQRQGQTQKQETKIALIQEIL
mgnify:CR=1 FL=1